MIAPHYVHIVDDEQSVRASIKFMLQTEGIRCSAYADGLEFLQAPEFLQPNDHATGCVLLDLRMPRMSGLEVQAQIVQRRLKLATIVMSGHADVPTTVEAIKLGAKDVLEKPFTGEVLLRTLATVWKDAKPQLEVQERMHWASSKVAELSAREREVLEALAGGLSNRKIAQQLGLSVRTVDMHRARMMKRLGANSLPQALEMWRTGEVFRSP